MYYLTDICFLCLKKNTKVRSVLFEDADGIIVNEKLRYFFPEIIDSTPDAHKLSCSECLEKLRISYDFKQSVIYNNTAFKDYIDKLQCQHKIHQQLFVVLAHSKRKPKIPPIRDITAKKVENTNEKLDNENFNLTSTNQQQLNTYDHSCQLTTNENVALSTKFICKSEEIKLNTENTEKLENGDEKINNDNFNLTSPNQQLHTYDHSCQLTTNENVTSLPKVSCQPEEINLNTANMEKGDAIAEIEEVFIKQEPVEDNFTTTCFDEESMEFEGNKSGTETNSCHSNTAEEECYSLCSNSNDCDVSVTAEEESNRSYFNTNDFNKKIEALVTAEEARYSLYYNSIAASASEQNSDTTTNLSNICDICQEMYKYLNNLLQHLNVHIEESNCAICKESSENISKFQRRMLVPCGSKCKPLDKQISEMNTKIPCAVCKKEFIFHNLKKHLYAHIHNLTCVLCAKPFVGRHGKQNLHRHLLLHCDVKPYQCEICSKRFTVRESLKYHMNYIHSKVSKKYVTCQYCKKSLSMNSLRKHIVQQHADETFKCEVCKKVYINSKNLEKHLKVHENREKMEKC